jgi:Fibronectin type III domain
MELMSSPQYHRRFPRVAALVALLIALVGATLVLAAPSANAATLPITVTATSPAPSTVEVRWTNPSKAPTQPWAIFIANANDGSYYGVRTASIGERSIRVTGLTAGRSYQFTVQAPSGTDVIRGVGTGTAQLAKCAGVSGPCVHAGITDGTATGVGQGFIFGLTENTPQSALTALQPQSWRVRSGRFNEFDLAREAGGDITLLLSAGWNQYKSQLPPPRPENPWDNWTIYRNFVIQTVRGHVQNGRVPEYWEIQNEPDNAWVFYSQTTPATRPLVLEQFRVAHDAIRSELPNARIVGPSLMKFRFNEPGAVLDIVSFLDFAVANGLRFDLSWHELGADAFGQPAGDPRATLEHVDIARQLIADRPALSSPTLGAPRILINEYGAPWSIDQPGATVAYLAALETAAVQGANRGCFDITVGTIGAVDTCFDPAGLLDGILLPSGIKTDNYWVHEAYATMKGTKLGTAITDRAMSALATVGSDGTLRALVGRHQSCSQAINEHCANGSSTSSPLSATTFVADRPSGTYAVVVKLVADTVGASVPVTVLATTVKTAKDGTVKVTLPPAPDGGAFIITVTKLSTLGWNPINLRR